MNLKQAEAFYKKYKGQKFHMYREDETLYHDFKDSDIPLDMINKWKKEIETVEHINSLKKDIKHLYVHVPFCNSICFYCDFTHRVYEGKLADRWLEYLEIEIRNNCFNKYETIYIGGGTPSCLDIRQLERLLALFNPYTDNVKEYTIEVNPESLDKDKVELFKKYHINRISMGIQSSDDELLKSLNRRHTFKDVEKGIELLKNNGFNNISVDLMYSLPDQGIEILNRTIDDILKLDVEHISLYSLTVEENTVFGKKGVRSLDEDIEADMYELIEKRLKENNYIHYEVSNYCKQGYESRHNMSYWNYEDFLGLSLGASGKIGNYRYTNTRSFDRYFDDINSKDEEVFLDRKDMMFEHIMMSLRTIYGLDIERFNKLYDCDLIDEYQKGINNPYIEIKDNRLICNNLELLNNILLDFM